MSSRWTALPLILEKTANSSQTTFKVCSCILGFIRVPSLGTYSATYTVQNSFPCAQLVGRSQVILLSYKGLLSVTLNYTSAVQPAARLLISSDPPEFP